MDVASMHIRFKIGLDKVDSLAYPNLLPEEIDTFLNIAQERFVKQRAYGNNFKKESLEQSQKRIDDLRSLVKRTSSILVGTDPDDSTLFTVNLPTDYMFMLRKYCKATGIICGKTEESFKLFLKQATNDNIDTHLIDPYNKPDKQEALVLFEGDKMLIYTDGSTTLNTVFFSYIKTPLELSITATGIGNPVGFTNQSELSVETHQEIVDIAVNIALETIESPRVQGNQVELSQQE